MITRKKFTIVMATLAALALVTGTAFANLITNGDFESGPSGFSSAYTYHAYDPLTDPADHYFNFYTPNRPLSLYDEKTWTVGTNPSLYHASWASFGAFSGTQMMIVNGATDVGSNVWASGPIAVTPGSTYYFGAYMASVYPQKGQNPIAPATLAFSINNVQLDVDFQLSASVGTWELFYKPWVADGTGFANLSLINRNSIASGNDFAIDDFSLDTRIPGVPEPTTMLLLGLGLVGLAGIRRRMK